MATKSGKTSGNKVKSLATKAVSEKQARKVKGGLTITKKSDATSQILSRGCNRGRAFSLSLLLDAWRGRSCQVGAPGDWRGVVDERATQGRR